MRYFVHLAYKGTCYYGWQIQAKEVTVQQVLNDAFSKIFKEEINLCGAGRTDTGVHATNFYAHFDSEQSFYISKFKNYIHHLNSYLPDDIVIFDIIPVKDNAHARFDAVERTYRYYICTQKNPFMSDRSYRIYFDPNLTQMNLACEAIKQQRDFTSFSKLHTDTKNNDCIVKHALWKKEKEFLVFEITANRFLRNMVRAIVGTLLEVGRGKINVQDFCEIMEAKDRCRAGTSVPAHALYLEEIVYPFL